MEVGNIAWECPTHTAYHINIDSVVFELVDPIKSGRGGRRGEAVVTCLYRYATPIIRYTTGDLVEVIDDECPCGRGLPLLKNVEGRVVDCVVKKDGSMISPYAVSSVLEHVGGVRRFKVLQARDYSVDVFIAPTDGADHERIAASVESALSDILRGFEFRVRIVEEIAEDRVKKFKPVESLVLR